MKKIFFYFNAHIKHKKRKKKNPTENQFSIVVAQMKFSLMGQNSRNNIVMPQLKSVKYKPTLNCCCFQWKPDCAKQ